MVQPGDCLGDTEADVESVNAHSKRKMYDGFIVAMPEAGTRLHYSTILAVDESWSGCGIGVPNGQLTTNIDPLSETMTLNLPNTGVDAITLDCESSWR